MRQRRLALAARRRHDRRRSTRRRCASACSPSSTCWPSASSSPPRIGVSGFPGRPAVARRAQPSCARRASPSLAMLAEVADEAITRQRHVERRRRCSTALASDRDIAYVAVLDAEAATADRRAATPARAGAGRRRSPLPAAGVRHDRRRATVRRRQRYLELSRRRPVRQRPPSARRPARRWRHGRPDRSATSGSA